jgi:hypothetical protein
MLNQDCFYSFTKVTNSLKFSHNYAFSKFFWKNQMKKLANKSNLPLQQA